MKKLLNVKDVEKNLKMKEEEFNHNPSILTKLEGLKVDRRRIGCPSELIK